MPKTKQQYGTMNPPSAVSTSKLSLFMKLCIFALLLGLGAAVYYYTQKKDEEVENWNPFGSDDWFYDTFNPFGRPPLNKNVSY